MALLEVDALAKRFGGLPAVDGVTFGVGEGEILAVVGPNGAGKSTLLKTIGGLERPSAGTVRLAGEPVDRLAAHRVRRKGIAMVMQTPLTFGSMTTLENVAVGAMFGHGGDVLGEPEAVRRAEEALAFVGLERRAGQPVGSLNLHQQRFLEMAKALAGRPRLLLIDEVMAGLNSVELAASLEIVRTARDTLGITIIWVEHVMKAVMSLAERVIVLNFGRMLAEGEPGAVMRHPAVIDAYLGQGHDA
ncbi:MAG TPA: ABC transporter ATP-binding protein [Actinomycetes bacterium]|jgi:ABC-type branched-subunit amino acid transport system ATPase component|nr:ABC transporter ATP-binding protein [Actinomycetes bacterium]